MFGPKEIGFWSCRRLSGGDTDWGILHSGQTYRVIKAFADHDNYVHPVGEQWTFLAYAFLPYDNGWQLFVTFDSKTEYSIPLWLSDPVQDEIEKNLGDYITMVPPMDTDG